MDHDEQTRAKEEHESLHQELAVLKEELATLKAASRGQCETYIHVLNNSYINTDFG